MSRTFSVSTLCPARVFSSDATISTSWTKKARGTGSSWGRNGRRGSEGRHRVGIGGGLPGELGGGSHLLQESIADQLQLVRGDGDRDVEGGAQGFPRLVPELDQEPLHVLVRRHALRDRGLRGGGSHRRGGGIAPQTPTRATTPRVGDKKRGRYGGTRRGARVGGEKHPTLTRAPGGVGAGGTPGGGSGGSREPQQPQPLRHLRATPAPLPLHPPPVSSGPGPAHRGHVPARPTWAGSGPAGAGGPERAAAAPWRPAVGTAPPPGRPRVRGRSGVFPVVTTQALLIVISKIKSGKTRTNYSKYPSPVRN